MDGQNAGSRIKIMTAVHGIRTRASSPETRIVTRETSDDLAISVRAGRSGNVREEDGSHRAGKEEDHLRERDRHAVVAEGFRRARQQERDQVDVDALAEEP